MEMLERIVQFYIESGDFNGMPLSRLLEESGHDPDELREKVATLVREGSISINFGDRHPNAHIKAFEPESAEEQIAKLQALNLVEDVPSEVIRCPGPEGIDVVINLRGGTLPHVCLYPEPAVLESRVDRTRYEGQPFTLRLALGEPHLAFEKFNLTILEHYRNDPRYHYDTNDVGGSIGIRDEFYLSDQVPESEKALLQTFGFGYDSEFNRAVVVFLRYLSDLTPEHQRIWQARIVSGNYWLHPDYARTTGGDWPEKMSLFDAFLLELGHINEMARLMGKPPLFREAPDTSSRPRGFAFLLRPTVKEFQDFVSLLDKLMSDNLSKEFFEGDIELSEDVPRKDGKVEVQHKGTIRLLDEWLSKFYRSRDPQPLKDMLATFRHVRKLRQRPAHALDDNRFDQAIFKEQRELAIRAYAAIRTIRLLFANHPHVRGYEVTEELVQGDIWSF